MKKGEPDVVRPLSFFFPEAAPAFGQAWLAAVPEPNSGFQGSSSSPILFSSSAGALFSRAGVP